MKAGEWPKWYRSAEDEVWKINEDGSGNYYAGGKLRTSHDVGAYSADKSLGTTFPEITAAEAKALIQKARAK